MSAADWPYVERIYAAGISGGQATFERKAPSWERWSAAKRGMPCLVARDGEDRVLGWAALTPVSTRECYRGVGAVSIYVDPDRARTRRRQGAAAGARGLGRAGFDLDAGGRHLPARTRPAIALHEGCGFRLVGVRKRVGPDARRQLARRAALRAPQRDRGRGLRPPAGAAPRALSRPLARVRLVGAARANYPRLLPVRALQSRSGMGSARAAGPGTRSSRSARPHGGAPRAGGGRFAAGGEARASRARRCRSREVATERRRAAVRRASASSTGCSAAARAGLAGAARRLARHRQVDAHEHGARHLQSGAPHAVRQRRGVGRAGPAARRAAARGAAGRRRWTCRDPARETRPCWRDRPRLRDRDAGAARARGLRDRLGADAARSPTSAARPASVGQVREVAARVMELGEGARRSR